MNLLFLNPQCDKVPICSPSPLQNEALGNLTSKVVIFVDDLHTDLAATDWEAPTTSTAVSDNGEEAFTTEELEFAPLHSPSAHARGRGVQGAGERRRALSHINAPGSASPTAGAVGAASQSFSCRACAERQGKGQARAET